MLYAVAVLVQGGQKIVKSTFRPKVDLLHTGRIQHGWRRAKLYSSRLGSNDQLNRYNYNLPSRHSTAHFLRKQLTPKNTPPRQKRTFYPENFHPGKYTV